MNMLDFLKETYPEDELLIADGFDNCIIGIDESSMRIIYSVSKCISQLVSEGMTLDEAYEHFGYNVSGAYVGEKTPIWCYDFFQY